MTTVINRIPIAPRVLPAKTPSTLEDEIFRLKSLVFRTRKSDPANAEEIVMNAYITTARKYVQLARLTRQSDYGWAALQFYDKAIELGSDAEREKMTAAWDYSCNLGIRNTDEIITEEDIDW